MWIHVDPHTIDFYDNKSYFTERKNLNILPCYRGPWAWREEARFYWPTPNTNIISKQAHNKKKILFVYFNIKIWIIVSQLFYFLMPPLFVPRCNGTTTAWQCCGSGSYVFGPPGSESFHHQAKKQEKRWFLLVMFCEFLMTFYLFLLIFLAG